MWARQEHSGSLYSPLLTHTPLSQQCRTSRGGAVVAGRKYNVGLEGSWEQD